MSAYCRGVVAENTKFGINGRKSAENDKNFLIAI